MMHLFRLDGKIALITGGSRGIGRAIAGAFAQMGAHVILTARGEAELQQAADEIRHEGGSAETAALDIADTEASQGFIQQTLGRHGALHILVNNAGMNIREPAADVNTEAFDRILNVNLRGAYFLSQAAGREMVKARQGKIINILSLTSFIGLTNVSAYAVSKGGMLQMTRALATEWAAHNVQVNGIAPGFILTDLNHKLWENEVMSHWGLNNTPAKRLGKPEDIIGAALFLASSASDFVTGQVITVDGGFLAGSPWPIETM
jgi:gluconate 5-dehydrogenase